MDATILQFFEEIRNPVLTGIFGVFSLLGEAAVISTIVLLVFWLAPKRVGEQALVTVLTGYPLNAYIKYTAARPRPYIEGVVAKLDPPLGASLDDFASLPSGHTQTTTGFFGAVASRSKRIVVWLLCILVVLLIAVSRIYFGVHNPSDVLAGLVLGVMTALLWALVYRVFYNVRLIFLLVFAATALVPVLFSPSREYVQAAGLLSGAAVALTALEFSTEKCVKFPRKIWRIPVGISTLAVAYVLTMFLPAGTAYSLLKWFLLAFTGIFIEQQLFEWLQI